MSRIGGKTERMNSLQFVFILSFVLLLSDFQWPMLFWLNAFVPVISFVVLYGLDFRTGNKVIAQSVLLTSIVAVWGGAIPAIFVSLATLPTGYMVAWSAHKSENQNLTGIKAFLTLTFCLLVLWGGLILYDKSFSYSSLVHSVQDILDATLNAYRQDSSIPVDKLIVIDEMLTQTRKFFPVVLPAVFGNFIVVSVLLTMALGNRLIRRYIGSAPWPEYRLWKIPDKFIWTVIVSASLILVPFEMIRNTGINLLLTVSVIYIFQGISIVVFFFDKWKMPLFFRIPLYTIAVIQASGTLLLLILGIADIWLDFRQLNR